jgi:hypothetical protein
MADQIEMVRLGIPSTPRMTRGSKPSGEDQDRVFASDSPAAVDRERSIADLHDRRRELLPSRVSPGYGCAESSTALAGSLVSGRNASR